MRRFVFGVLATTCMAQFPPVISVWNAAGFSLIVPYRAVAAGSRIVIRSVPAPTDPDPSHYAVRILPQNGPNSECRCFAHNLTSWPCCPRTALLESSGNPGGARADELAAKVQVVPSVFGFFSLSGSGMGPVDRDVAD